jgi:ATP-dependent Clp protease ATP-binding subunit ClpA
MQHKVLDEIRRHFKLVLNRPEILNRIGENIIVFDFIRPDVAAQIFDQMVEAIETDLAVQGYQVRLNPTARDALRHVCLSDLSNGGRGIRNQLEAHLLNPLSRQLFDVGGQPGDGFELQSNGAELQLVRV